MPNLLKRLKISSVDLCKRGANPLAKIALSKSRDAEGGWRTRIGELLLSGAPLSKVFEEIGALIGEGERGAVVPDAGADLASDAAVANAGAAFDGAYRRGDSADVDLGYDDSTDEDSIDEDSTGDDSTGNATANGARRAYTSATDAENAEATSSDAKRADKKRAPVRAAQARRKECRKTYAGAPCDTSAPCAEPDDALHPEVKKALGEVRALKEDMERARISAVAKRYDGVCGGADELAQRLARLKAAGGGAYDDYIALLDELADAKRVAPLMKEYGTSRGADGSLESRVSELMRAQPALSRAQAVVKAYQLDPTLPEVL